MTVPPIDPIHRQTVTDNLKRLKRQTDRTTTAPMGHREVRPGEGSIFWTDTSGGVIIRISADGFELMEPKAGQLVSVEVYVKQRITDTVNLLMGKLQQQADATDERMDVAYETDAKLWAAIGDMKDPNNPASMRALIDANNKLRADGDQALWDQIDLQKNPDVQWSLRWRIDQINARLTAAGI